MFEVLNQNQSLLLQIASDNAKVHGHRSTTWLDTS